MQDKTEQTEQTEETELTEETKLTEETEQTELSESEQFLLAKKEREEKQKAELLAEIDSISDKGVTYIRSYLLIKYDISGKVVTDLIKELGLTKTRSTGILASYYTFLLEKPRSDATVTSYINGTDGFGVTSPNTKANLKFYLGLAKFARSVRGKAIAEAQVAAKTIEDKKDKAKAKAKV